MDVGLRGEVGMNNIGDINLSYETESHKQESENVNLSWRTVKQRPQRTEKMTVVVS